MINRKTCNRKTDLTNFHYERNETQPRVQLINANVNDMLPNTVKIKISLPVIGRFTMYLSPT